MVIAEEIKSVKISGIKLDMLCYWTLLYSTLAMADIEANIKQICDKLDSLSTEIKANNVTLDRCIARTEQTLKINEQQLNDIKGNLQVFSNKLAEVEESQSFISTQYDTQKKRQDTIILEHTKMKDNVTGLKNELEKLKKDLKMKRSNVHVKLNIGKMTNLKSLASQLRKEKVANNLS